MKIKDFREKYRVVRNPLKAKFKRLKISNGELSNFLGISSSRVNQYLNGFTGTPLEIEEKLQALAKELKE